MPHCELKWGIPKKGEQEYEAIRGFCGFDMVCRLAVYHRLCQSGVVENHIGYSSLAILSG